MPPEALNVTLDICNLMQLYICVNLVACILYLVRSHRGLDLGLIGFISDDDDGNGDSDDQVIMALPVLTAHSQF